MAGPGLVLALCPVSSQIQAPSPCPSRGCPGLSGPAASPTHHPATPGTAAHASWPPTSAPWRGHADTWHVTRLVTSCSVIDSYRHKYASRIQKLSHSRWKISGNVDTVDFYLNKCFSASMFSRTIHLNISTESLHLHRIFMFWWNSKWFSAFCFKLIELLKYEYTMEAFAYELGRLLQSVAFVFLSLFTKSDGNTNAHVVGRCLEMCYIWTNEFMFDI